MGQDWLLQWLCGVRGSYHRFLSVIFPIVLLSKVLHRKGMFVWGSNDHVLINSKTIPFDSTLHGRDYLFLSYGNCPSLLSQFLHQDWNSKVESVDTLQAIISSKFELLPMAYLFQGNQCVIETYKSSHYSSLLSFPEQPLQSPYSTSKPSYTSHQLESAPFRAVHGVTSFPVQLSFPITPSFPHYTSPRHELTSTVTEQICFATSCAGKVPSRNQYNPGSTWRQVRPTFPSFERVKALGKGLMERGWTNLGFRRMFLWISSLELIALSKSEKKLK